MNSAVSQPQWWALFSVHCAQKKMSSSHAHKRDFSFPLQSQVFTLYIIMSKMYSQKMLLLIKKICTCCVSSVWNILWPCSNKLWWCAQDVTSYTFKDLKPGNYTAAVSTCPSSWRLWASTACFFSCLFLCLARCCWLYDTFHYLAIHEFDEGCWESLIGSHLQNLCWESLNSPK